MPPQWVCMGGDGSRNNVNTRAKNLPADFSADDQKNPALLWKLVTGTRSYGQPVCAGGYILTGTNNDHPQNPRDATIDEKGKAIGEDKGILLCVNAQTGAFVWQAIHDMLPGGTATDWPRIGIPSTPYVDAHRVYYMSNRCELVCADLEGFSNGNQGISTEQYKDRTDADILWKRDLLKDYGVYPCSKTSCSPLVVDNTVYILTGNSVNEKPLAEQSPDAPSFMAFDKFTGELRWKEKSTGKNTQYGQFSSPAYAETPVPQVIFPGGDGWLYSFEPNSGKLLWKFDGNAKAAIYVEGGKGDRNEFVAMPVILEGKLYIGTGRNPNTEKGMGRLWCIDLAKAVAQGKVNAEADVSPVKDNFDPKAEVNKNSAFLWHYGGDDKRKYPQRKFTLRPLDQQCSRPRRCALHGGCPGVSPLPRCPHGAAALGVQHEGGNLGFADLRRREGLRRHGHRRSLRLRAQSQAVPSRYG